MNRPLQVQQFAALAGVTVRALHHYDRLGLLRPQRTEAGYRVYTLRDLERLEQIVALKFIGLPLKRIKEVLDRDRRDFSDVLRIQRQALEQKRSRLEQAIGAIRQAERQPDAAALKNIIEVIQMQEDTEFLNRYYSESAQQKLAGRREQWSPELQERTTQAWTDLFRDVEASLNEDPHSAKAQALAARWKELVGQFTGGDPEMGDGVKQAWAGRAEWPSELQRKTTPFSNPQVWEFIAKASGRS